MVALCDGQQILLANLPAMVECDSMTVTATDTPAR
jgi:hypothetical protein